MGTLIRVIFREGVPRQRAANRAVPSRRSAIARERGLTLWRERDDLVIAAAYRVAPQSEARSKPDAQVASCVPLKFAPLA
jgi:hypothetical protein